jgi:hypothetical protein
MYASQGFLAAGQLPGLLLPACVPAGAGCCSRRAQHWHLTADRDGG